MKSFTYHIRPAAAGCFIVFRSDGAEMRRYRPESTGEYRVYWETPEDAQAFVRQCYEADRLAAMRERAETLIRRQQPRLNEFLIGVQAKQLVERWLAQGEAA